MTTPEERRRRELEMRWLQRFTLVIVLALAVYQLAVVNPRQSEAIDQNAQSKVALCALRADLKARITQTQKFLMHPQDFPGFNDPKTIELIRQQVEGQRRTVAALSVLSC